MDVIEVQSLTKVYQTGLKKGNLVALDEVNLVVTQGEIFGLLGPNGAGKTTLVKCLLGITGISAGQVLLNGLPPDDPRSREKVGFLPENHRFPSHLTGVELLELSGKLSGMSTGEIAKRIDYLLPLVGMNKWAGMRVTKYSKGMSQRIGLAQAMISDPDILFLDEPTDGVDPIGRKEIKDVLKKIRDAGKTVFLNSHLLAEVESLADRVMVLNKGRVIRTASVKELTSHDKQYVIIAEIGNERIEISKEIGKRISISRRELIVELYKEDDINKVIDQLRLKRISIRAVTPRKVSLEQSFIELVSDSAEPAS